MNVLVVDDIPDVANGIVKKINWKELGISNAFCAYSAREARRYFSLSSSDKIDILLCDIEMPEGSGLELLSWIRDHHFSLECVFLTSHAEFNYAMEAIKLGSFDYILQPAPYEEIEQILRRTIEKVKEKDHITQILTSRKEEEARSLPVRYDEDDSDNTVSQIITYIDEHINENIRRKEIAEHIHLNEDYMAKLFKKEKGMQLKEYILERKMDIAKNLLVNSSLSVSIIALKVGFSNFSHFSQTFKKIEGITPNEYRAIRQIK